MFTLKTANQVADTILQPSSIQPSNVLQLLQWGRSDPPPQQQSTTEQLINWFDANIMENDTVAQNNSTDQINVNDDVEEQHTSKIRTDNEQLKDFDRNPVATRNQQIGNDQLNNIDQLNNRQLADITNSQTIILNRQATSVSVEGQTFEKELIGNGQTSEKDGSDTLQNITKDKNTKYEKKEKSNEKEIRNICKKILRLKSPIMSASDITKASTRVGTDPVQNRTMARKKLEKQGLLGT
ncbi:unnamed protein product, partial [Didymodactylos carnosus]